MLASMFRNILLIIILAISFCAVRAEAAEPSGWCWKMPSWLGVDCGCCPDDYCAKPLPGVPCAADKCCNDIYCKKPLPAIPCENCQKTCDCYDCKPLPAAPRCCEPWYKCIPFCPSK